MNEPQQILNSLHDLKIEKLANEALSNNERKAEIRVFKQKLRLVKRKLSDAIATVKKTWDARKGDEEKQRQAEALEPLKALNNLIAEIEIYLSELENSITFSRDLPSPPVLQEFIIPTSSGAGFFNLQQAIDFCRTKNLSAIERAKQFARELREDYSEVQKELDQSSDVESYFDVTLSLEYLMQQAKLANKEAKLFLALQDVTNMPICSDYIPVQLKIIFPDNSSTNDKIQIVQTKKATLERMLSKTQDLPHCQDLLMDFISTYDELIASLRQ